MKTWPIIALVAGLIACLALVLSLGRAVKSDLDALSTARTDDLSWLISQLEVELLRFEVAVIDAQSAPDPDLRAVRGRFDIFYSRAGTLFDSAIFAFLRETGTAQPALQATEGFLSHVTPLIDGPDGSLRVALPDIRSRIQSLRPEIRALALDGIQGFALQNATRRADLSATLSRLASLLLVLFAALLVAFAVLVKLFRRGQVFARESQAARTRFEAAISSSLDAVLVVDTSGRILEFNGAAEQVFGYTRAEAIGADMADLIVPEHLRALHRKGMARFLTTGTPKVIGAGRVRLEGLRKSRQTFPVELSISLSETDGERVFVSYLRDITEELRAEEDLRAARDKAQESEQAKSDLLTVMSHEMRTPLNGILGSLELMQQDRLTDRQRRHLHAIEVSGKLLLSHVTDVLDFSRLGAGHRLGDPAPFDLPRLVQAVTDSLAASATARDNRLDADMVSPDLEQVIGHRTALQQCLVNLVGNAVAFTSGGIITVEVERLSGDDLVEFRVADTGVGIAPDYLDVIFDEFVTIDTAFARDGSGTGLGLAITKRLVEAMGGDITADSIPGEGSLFSMRLPLPRHVPPALTNAPPPPGPGPGHGAAQVLPGQTALVVDDNDINRTILRDMLNDLGFAVVDASNGHDAIDLLARRPFDILLLDISMPGIDGIETLRRVRKLDTGWRDLPAIAVTAHAAAKDHATIRAETFQGLLVKPVSLSGLRAELSAALPGDVVAGGDQVPGSDFRARFGEDRYQAALTELHADVTALLAALRAGQMVDAADRDEAHRLSGSAAILGQHMLWQTLQAIQNCEASNWPSCRSRYLQDLEARAAGLNA
ncbi:MAG: ATP-binding protein [Marinibacterium sp.]|nr:ATP-binding protein [Marinibacterium sp.]